ncbi:hypothetical protein AB1Y20_022406 [Prymnesium parvum]|uniref:cysteine-S-conjugate beta-lyase n=1 Tax=Prymnesium parvum TaxID=97485 RepID=A0AB34JFT5_PRYPA
MEGSSEVNIPPLPSACLDRAGTSSRKVEGKHGTYTGRDIVPMWIAGMDFEAPQPVIEAVVERAKHGIYGYTDAPSGLSDLAVDRLQTIYQSAEPPQRSWLHWIPGLIGGLHYAVRATCDDQAERVAVLTPIYPPFLGSVRSNGATLVQVPLREGGATDSSRQIRFVIDWVLLERELAHPRTRLLHFCNPHNPAGRCWSVEELERVCRMCVANDVSICSDEVWGEMPLSRVAPFTSLLSFLPHTLDGQPAGVEGLRERLMVLISPSKCFNVASLDLALAVVPDDTLRRKYRASGADSAEVTPFGYVAAQAAYGHPDSEAWRQRLISYLQANRDFAFETLTSARGVRATCPEASYLMWIEVPDLGVPAVEFFEQHGVGLTGAVDFGGAANCCRLNFACSRATLKLALDRMLRAMAPSSTL